MPLVSASRRTNRINDHSGSELVSSLEGLRLRREPPFSPSIESILFAKLIISVSRAGSAFPVYKIASVNSCAACLKAFLVRASLVAYSCA
eukprot:1703698-Amphidinium_carterae.1